MNMLQLLDQIDETAPRDCKTCVHMATHRKCDGCLNTPEDYESYRNGGEMHPFRYAHWEPGNWLRAEHAEQLAGRKRITIGGQGEADICATARPADVSRSLRHVAGECGYWVLPMKHDGPEKSIEISTHDGHWRIVWVNDELDRIEQVNPEDTRWHWSWNRDIDKCYA